MGRHVRRAGSVVFEADRPRAAIARTRAFARGELDTASEIRQRFGGGSAARETKSPAAAAAARAAGQASAVCHMGAHALGRRPMQSMQPVWRLQIAQKPPTMRSGGNSYK
ncbi:MAG: hypothetical protein KME20_27950 [Kaiparowitsia implicata GSE-PSE-MK54-09C]|nr:hypothetical protein [Kaiparowitsia implicata GSE-PSE-MK54-09C]